MPTPPKSPIVSKKDVGERLRTLRIERGLTQVQLAEMVGTHQTALSQVEVGRRGVSLDQILKLARALKVTPDQILGETPPPNGTRPQSGRLLKRIERIEALPQAKQRALLQMIDAFIEKHARE
jgi:transcriptional regulator with XRE-family HTH domain